MVVCDRSKLDRRGVRGAPDLVMEILSASSSRYDRHVKLRLYEKAGVREYWIVDPERRSVQIYSLENGAYGPAVIYTALAAAPVGVLPGCAVDLATVFPE